MRPLPGRARASLRLLAQPAVPLRAGSLWRRGGAGVVSARGPRHVGNRHAVRNTVTALALLDSLYGTYQWPQLTNVHRIEGGGPEVPMVIMDGSAGIGLIVHETGHQYTMGQLANNEWREGWLDEGFTSFQT